MVDTSRTCTSPSDFGSKPCFETPTLVTPLLLPEHDGQDRFAEEHMSMDMVESWNGLRDQEAVSIRPSSARPSMSELEAEFEAKEPLYYMPLKPGMAKSTADFPGNYGCNSGGSSSSHCLLAYEMDGFSSSPFNGNWLGGGVDAMDLMPEIAEGGIAANSNVATRARPHRRVEHSLPPQVEGSTKLASSLAATVVKAGNQLADSNAKPLVLTRVEQDGKATGIPGAGNIRNSSQNSSTGQEICHVTKTVMHGGSRVPSAPPRGISCRRMLPGRSLITIGPPALSTPNLLEGNSLADALRLDDPYHGSQRSGSAQSCQERITDLCPVFVDVDNCGGATCIEPMSSNRRSGSRKSSSKRPNSGDDTALTAIRSGRRAGEYTHINQDMLKDGGYFDMPIQEAAQQLGIGLSVLKRVCRTIGLARWPFRKRQSLRNVMEQTKLYLNDIDFASKDKVMRLLDQAAASLDGSTGEDLGPAFKRYRQAVFKLNYKINKLKDNKKGGNGVRVAIPKSAAASLEALACFALDGCEEPFGSGEYQDMASTAVKNPFGGGDVKGSVAVKAFGAGVESLANSAAARLNGQLPCRLTSAKARDRTVAVAVPSHAVPVPFRPRERTIRRAAFVNAAAVSKAAAAADAASDSSSDSGDMGGELDVND